MLHNRELHTFFYTQATFYIQQTCSLSPIHLQNICYLAPNQPPPQETRNICNLLSAGSKEKSQPNYTRSRVRRQSAPEEISCPRQQEIFTYHNFLFSVHYEGLFIILVSSTFFSFHQDYLIGDIAVWIVFFDSAKCLVLLAMYVAD